MRFQDRRTAGRALGERVRERRGELGLHDPLVLALPRGGLPVGDEVARALGAPLDVLVARKVGLPEQPELGVGAIVGDSPPLFDETALRALGLTEEDLAPVVERERAELRRREGLYRRGRPAPEVRGRSVVIVDDGLATGSTARASLRALRERGPGRVVLAAPVCAPGTARGLRGEADALVCLHQPEDFQAVGVWYEDFGQLTDEDVLEVLLSSVVRRASGFLP